MVLSPYFKSITDISKPGVFVVIFVSVFGVAELLLYRAFIASFLLSTSC
nr:MAG TPA: hypothetical protein [Caudoviricetes sp.]